MKRILVLLLALALGLGCMSAVAEEIDWRAHENSELMVYVGCDEEHGAAVIKAFQEKTGINTSYIRLSGNECYNRILKERDDPQADVWYGGTWDPYIAAENAGLLYEYKDFQHAAYKSPNYGIGEPYWFGIYSGYIGFICDMRALEAAGVEAPKSWEDLAKPEYEGMICMANPNATGTGVMTVSILWQIFGQERAAELIEQIDKNVVAYVQTGSDTSEMVAEGGAAIGVGFLHTGLMYLDDGDEDIGLFAPSEGTGYEVGGTAIIENCKHPEEAKLFLAFAMSPECQEIGQTVGALQFLTVEGAQDPAAAQMLLDMGVNLIDYDSVWTAEHKDEMIQMWTGAITASKIKTD